MSEPTTKIHGKRVTESKLIQEIHSLLHGTGSRPYPLSVTEVAKTLGVSRMTVYRYIRKMKKVRSKTKRRTLAVPSKHNSRKVPTVQQEPSNNYRPTSYRLDG